MHNSNVFPVFGVYGIAKYLRGTPVLLSLWTDKNEADSAVVRYQIGDVYVDKSLVSGFQVWQKWVNTEGLGTLLSTHTVGSTTAGEQVDVGKNADDEDEGRKQI